MIFFFCRPIDLWCPFRNSQNFRMNSMVILEDFWKKNKLFQNSNTPKSYLPFFFFFLTSLYSLLHNIFFSHFPIILLTLFHLFFPLISSRAAFIGQQDQFYFFSISLREKKVYNIDLNFSNKMF